ncbi:MAG: hypothetical protein ABR985_18545 [Methanotrichaceae archaeon]|jgi:hypothetical protein
MFKLCVVFFITVGSATLVQAKGNVIYTEPTEKAFSFEAPQGWNIQCGIYRNPSNPSIDVRPYIRATSPDGWIIITQWDSRVSDFYTTRQISGLDFAKLYLQQYPEAGCTGITITSADENKGRLTYRCYKNGQLMAGAVGAVTSSIGSDWTLKDLSSYLAPASQENVAISACETLRATLQWNPQWSSSNYKNALNANQQYTNRGNQIVNGLIGTHGTITGWNNAGQHAMNNWDHVINNEPTTEQYMWNCGGQIIYTNGQYEPRAGCTLEN